MIMTDKATPTITLAELYENQNQYIDALVIYKKLYKDNASEELQNKIDELKDTIFKENTLEYSTIIDKIFTEEEKRIFHILPHEQYKAYTESQAELKYDETYPEELIEIKKEENILNDPGKLEIKEKIIPDYDDMVEPEELIEKESEELIPDDLEIPQVNEKKTIEPDDILDSDNTLEDDISLEIDKDISDDLEKEEIPLEPNSKSEDLDTIEDIVERKEETEQKELSDTKETIESENTLDNDLKSKDDISLEIDEDVSEDLEELEIIPEPVTQSEDEKPNEEQVEKKTEEKNEVIETEEPKESVNIKDELDAIEKSDDDNHILNLLTKLSEMRPDIVERVLKENVGQDRSLSEIKLSDLNFVVELLKASDNVEKK